MAARLIIYHLKGELPKNKLERWVVISTAYRAARHIEKEPRRILLRGGIHNTTSVDGVYVPDDPHITVCVKNEGHIRDKTHIAAHAYTNTNIDEPWEFPKEDLKIKPTKVKADKVKTRRGKPTWPENLEEFSVIHVDPKDLETLDEKELASKYADDVGGEVD